MENLENVATRVIMLVCEGLLTTTLIILMLFSLIIELHSYYYLVLSYFY